MSSKLYLDPHLLGPNGVHISTLPVMTHLIDVPYHRRPSTVFKPNSQR